MHTHFTTLTNTHSFEENSQEIFQNEPQYLVTLQLLALLLLMIAAFRSIRSAADSSQMSKMFVCLFVCLPPPPQEATGPRTACCSTGPSPGSPSASARPSRPRSCCAWSGPSRRTTTWWGPSGSSWPAASACRKHRSAHAKLAEAPKASLRFLEINAVLWRRRTILAGFAPIFTNLRRQI